LSGADRMSRLAFLLAGLLLGANLLFAQPIDPVSVRPFHEVALPDTGSAPASVIAPNDSRIAAEVTARVARIHAEVGSIVKAGALLLELDDADDRLALTQAEAQVSAAQARVALAEQRRRQALSLRQKQFVSDDAVLELQTGVQAAEAELAVAQARRAVAARTVEKCRIIAPFAGVVLERQAQVGALATPGTPLLRLVDLAPPEIEAQIPAAWADELPQARDLLFDRQGQRYPIRLLRLSPVVDMTARTRIARLAFTDPTAPAGSSGLLRWTGAGAVLPAELLVQRGAVLGVFVVNDHDRARFVPAPDAQPGRPFPIILPPEALVVTHGHQGLTDGQPVTMGGAR
jgi:RND family efflux transporter MFP subunit